MKPKRIPLNIEDPTINFKSKSKKNMEIFGKNYELEESWIEDIDFDYSDGIISKVFILILFENSKQNSDFFLIFERNTKLKFGLFDKMKDF